MIRVNAIELYNYEIVNTPLDMNTHIGKTMSMQLQIRAKLREKEYMYTNLPLKGDKGGWGRKR